MRRVSLISLRCGRVSSCGLTPFSATLYFVSVKANSKTVLMQLVTNAVATHGTMHGLRIIFIHSFIHQWLYNPLLGPGLFFSSVIIFTQSVWPVRWVISPSQGRYLDTGQHEHRIDLHTNIRALSWIRTHDPSVRAGEDSSCLKPRGHYDRREVLIPIKIRGLTPYSLVDR
jgi:hypothetical protein